MNIAARLTAVAQAMPHAVAVVEPLGYDSAGKRRYRQISFRELDDDSDRVARGLRQLGVTPGTRMALLVRPGVDFVSLVLALFKAGAVTILIDPGMGRRNLIRCLAEARPQGFVAIPLVHAIRALLPGRFPEARMHVTVGRRWFWGGVTLDQLRRGGSGGQATGGTRSGTGAGGTDSSALGVPQAQEVLPISLAADQRDRAAHSAPSVPAAQIAERSGSPAELAVLGDDDPAAIIFTTGSTGPPKGVLYRHGNFAAQVDQIRECYGMRPGEIDLAAFPLFGLFNCALGVTAIIPDMDPSRPARVDPARIIEAIEDWKVTQAFGSPAIWRRVGRYCRQRGIRLATVRRVLSAGAPVPVDVLRDMKASIHPEGDMHTPYGATEALPVASIAASEVLSETAARTQQGAGVCVGRRFSSIAWKVIRIVDGPIASIDQVEELPTGEIGELIVRGPQVTRQYVTRVDCNALAKIADGGHFWHRMGDVGYLDEQQRFWMCGRMAHRVETAAGTMFTIPCEAIFNQHPAIGRSALVGVGPSGRQRPVIVLEPNDGGMPRSRQARETLLREIRQLGREHPQTATIADFLVHPAFPVDIRHNAKIFREELAVWAAKKLRSVP